LNVAQDEHAETGPSSFWAASIVAACIIAAVLVILPFGSTSLPVIPPFVPMANTTVCIVEGLTAYFLAIQFRASGEAFLGALAGAYGFVMVTAVLQLLIFPGVFTKTGLLGAGPQSAIWLWVMWHAGFPALAGLAMATRLLPDSSRLRRAGVALMLGGPAAAVLFGYLSIAGGGVLPPLIHGASYQALRHSPAAALVLASNVVALVACIRLTGLRSLLSLWLAVTLLANLGDAVLVIIASARYSLGWYSARTLSVLSSSVLLCVMISEFARLHERLASANRSLAARALHDGLTGAFNRGYFSELLPREISRAIRGKAPLSLLMIDVDHFKLYNDIHGHQTGDACLIGIVGGIMDVLRRPTDFVVRYGGEEFAVVLPGTGRDGAAQMIAEIRCAVRRLELPAAASGGPVTISLGVATFDPRLDLIAPEELIRRADLALYTAKRSGRDAVCEFEAASVGA
jgi:diguanylate cyclase (GGDEF)-like protein